MKQKSDKYGLQVVGNAQYPDKISDLTSYLNRHGEERYGKVKGRVGARFGFAARQRRADNSSGDRLATVAVKISATRPLYQARCSDRCRSPCRKLADSIKALGVIQPVVVREHGLSRYELSCGGAALACRLDCKPDRNPRRYQNHQRRNRVGRGFDRKLPAWKPQPHRRSWRLGNALPTSSDWPLQCRPSRR